MAFEANENTGTGSFSKKTGIVLAKQALKINPTLKELNEIGIKFENEPVYTGETIDNKKYINVVIWFKTEAGHVPAKFMITDEIRKSEKEVVVNGVKQMVTKYQFIDKFGRTCWAINERECVETRDFNGETKVVFEKVSAKKAHSGEEEFVQFFKNVQNVKKGGEATFDVAKALKGYLSELRAIPVSNIGIWALLTVQNQKYQSIYTRWSARGFSAYQDVCVKLKQYADKQLQSGYPLKDAWSIELKEYTGATPDNDVPQSTPNNFKQQEESDGLPF